MKTLNEISNSIAREIGKIAKEVSEDYDIVVCPERIFVDDYLERKSQAETANNLGIPYAVDDVPNDTYYSKTIFFVIKVGNGQRNMAVSNSDVTIRALSEENDFVVAREILERFVAEYNFKYDDEEGIAQAYFNPEVANAMEEVYVGFRALLNVRGFVRIPADGSMFINAMAISFSDDNGDEHKYQVPFLNVNYNWSSQPDPQAFAGYNGQTKALNRQSTEVVAFTTYLKYYGDGTEESAACDAFTMAIFGSKNRMNRKFRIRLSFQNGVVFVDDFFVLTGVAYAQQLADLDVWNLSFTSAKEDESNG